MQLDFVNLLVVMCAINDLKIHMKCLCVIKQPHSWLYISSYANFGSYLHSVVYKADLNYFINNVVAIKVTTMES